MRVKRYQYRVVTSCGAGVHTKATTFSRAVRSLARVIARGYKDVEIERVLAISRDGRTQRYWLRRGGRWRVYPERAFEPQDSDYAYWRERAQRGAA